jgi:hypothetical protein
VSLLLAFLGGALAAAWYMAVTRWLGPRLPVVPGFAMRAIGFLPPAWAALAWLTGPDVGAWEAGLFFLGTFVAHEALLAATRTE